MKDSDLELIFEIYRLKKGENWCPAIKDISSHDVSSLWIAGVMFSIFSRYIESFPDSEQNDIKNETMFLLEKMFESGYEYIERASDL